MGILGAIGSGFKRLGQGVGLVGPDDNVDENAVLSTVDQQAAENYRRALELQDQAQAWQGPSAVAGATLADPERVVANYARSITPDQPVERYQAALAGPTRDVQMAPVSTAVTADNLGRAAEGSAAMATASKVGGNADALRSQQIDAADRIANGPSSAAAQYQAALSGIADEQMGLVAGARGADRAGARREAILGMRQKGAAEAATSAALAAQEQQQRNLAASQALSGIRASDIETATTNAQLAQQASMANASAVTNASLQNAAAANALKQAQGAQNLTARQSTVQAGLDAAKSAADVASATAGRQDAISARNAEATTAAMAAGANAANTRAQANAAQDTSVSLANATTANTVNTGNAERQAAKDVTQANLNMQAQTANQSAGTAGYSAKQGATQSAAQLAQGATGEALGSAQAKMGAAAEQGKREDASSQRLVSAAATGLSFGMGPKPSAPQTSDERAKTDIKNISEADLFDLAEKMKAKSFRYKPGFEDGGEREHVGVMAQDLEKSRVGEKFVTTAPNGYKQVDYGGLEALGPLMAAAAVKHLRRKEA